MSFENNSCQNTTPSTHLKKYAHNVNVNMQAKLRVRLKQLLQLLHMVFVYAVIQFSKRFLLFI